MNVTTRKKLSAILCAALIAATALCAAGCSNSKTATPPPQDATYSASATPHALGEGETTFPFSVVDLNGQEVLFEISTNAETVGEALEAVGLIAGEEGPYGLMITTVNGLTLVYETDKAYWAFYIDGEYAMTGVDSTDIAAGQSYCLKAEKA